VNTHLLLGEAEPIIPIPIPTNSRLAGDCCSHAVSSSSSESKLIVPARLGVRSLSTSIRSTSLRAALVLVDCFLLTWAAWRRSGPAVGTTFFDPSFRVDEDEDEAGTALLFTHLPILSDTDVDADVDTEADEGLVVEVDVEVDVI
jgi:hypothetical protein